MRNYKFALWLLVSFPCHSEATCQVWQKQDGASCITCVDGQVVSTTNTQECTPCPDGTIRGNYAGNGASDCVPASSTNGCGLHQKAIGGKCVTCADGFVATNDYKECQVCPDGTIRGNYAGNGAGGCISPSSPDGCGLHQKAIAGKCVTCSDGFIATSDYLACQVCPDGTIRGNYAGNGDGGCISPSSANGCGLHQKAIGGKCVTCTDGFVATNDYKECQVCPDGSIRGNYAGNGDGGCISPSSTNGCGLHQKAVAGKCVTCSDGFVATGDYLTCQVCPDGTIRGNYAGNGPGGCVSPSSTTNGCGSHQKAIAGKCVTCSDGFIATSDYLACQVCPDGTIRGNYAGNGDGGCISPSSANGCGLHQKATGGKCVTCTDGFIATNDYLACQVCPDGTIRGNYAGNGDGGCISPSSTNGCGLHQKAVAGKCVTCSDGFVATGDYLTCQVCPDGTIRGNYAGNGPGGCVSPSSTTNGCGSHQKAIGGKCVTCSDGFVATSDYKDCQVCPDGTIRGNYAGNGDGGCISPSGSNGCGLHQKAIAGKCVTCTDGYIATADYLACQVCPDGTIRGNYAGNGPGGCVLPSSLNGCGLHQKAIGGICVTCSDGFIATSDYKDCQVCPDGTIRGNYAGNGPGGCVFPPSTTNGCGLHQKAIAGKCVTCSDGFVATSDYKECQVCPDGTIRSNFAGNGPGGCVLPSSPNGCGLHQKAIGGICVICSDGFIATSDYKDCQVCPDGTIRGNYAGNGAGGCISPLSPNGCGLHQKAIAGKCVTCTDGFIATGDYLACVVCPDGTIRGNYAGAGSTGCISPSGPNGCGLHQKAKGGKCVKCLDGFAATSDYKDCQVCPDGTVRGDYAGAGLTGCLFPSGICSSCQKAVGGKCSTCPSGLVATIDFKNCCKVKKYRGSIVCLIPPIKCPYGKKLVNGVCVVKKRL